MEKRKFIIGTVALSIFALVLISNSVALYHTVPILPTPPVKPELPLLQITTEGASFAIPD